MRWEIARFWYSLIQMIFHLFKAFCVPTKLDIFNYFWFVLFRSLWFNSFVSVSGLCRTPFFEKSYLFHIAFLIAVFTHSSPSTIICQTELSVARLPFTFHFSCLSYFYISWSSQPPLSFHIIVSNCRFIYLLSYSKNLGSLSPTCSVVWISIGK